jgi:hypothetical protein
MDRTMSKNYVVLGDSLAEKDPVESLWKAMTLIPQIHVDCSLEARVLWLTGLFELELVNGGFHQFMFNPYGNYSLDTVQALEQIDALISSGLLKEVMALFPEGVVPVD